MMTLTIGSRKPIPVADYADASAKYDAARTASGMGMSRFPDGKIMIDPNTQIARVSYNARVWPMGDWHPDMKPLFDNRASA